MEERLFAFFLLAFVLNLLVARTHQQNSADSEGGSGGYSFSGDDGIEEDDDKDEVTESTGTEGSGGARFDDREPDLTTCERQQQKAASLGRPKIACSGEGKFKAIQCDRARCWCVDKDDGTRTPGTETVLPNRPECGRNRGGGEIVVRTRKPSMAEVPDLQPEGRITDDITIDEPSSPRPMEPEKGTRRTPKTQSTTTSHDPDYDHTDGTVNAQKPAAFYSFLFRDPLIFAGIVGGAVLALLCIVLLVMFTIYRMRKKDEGSYALDEPKKSYGFAYTRARDKEFFA